MFLIGLSIVIAFIVALLRMPTVKGFLGELAVRCVIGSSSEKPGKERFVCNNFLMQLENGKSAQIDHILINRNGIFVIETKNFSGDIYGDDVTKEWTQVLNYGRIKNRFYSPVRQNAAHVHHVKTILPPETPVYSAVVFVKGNVSFIKSECVYTMWELRERINTPSKKPLSGTEIKRLGDIFLKYRETCSITSAEHEASVRDNAAKIAENICPRCNGVLLERKGKHGNFLGCSNYPKCRFTARID